MTDVYQFLKKKLSGHCVRENVLMDKFTTIKIGGPADLFVEVKAPFDLINVVTICQELEVSYLILGGGSNTLIGDKGFRGLIIKNRGGEIKQLGANFIEVASGTLNRHVVHFIQKQGLTGLEFLVGIPGTVGAAVRNNGHFRSPESFGQYFADFTKVKDNFVNNLVEDTLIITPAGQIRRVGVDYLQPEYHRSRLKETDDIVISTKFRLEPSDPEIIKTTINAMSKWRRERKVFQPTSNEQSAMPADLITGHQARQPNALSLGSTFSNTPNPENHPTGRLLDLCGLKGRRVGNMVVSSDHANWIINLGHGKAADMLALINICKEAVHKRFGVELALEIDLVGEF
jgi:UDP-N-acetylmuramate dehydrogenase